MKTHFDALILGTGQAGPSLANRLNAEGRSVAIVERGRIGGTCVNAGCTPTKTLIASARVAHVARRAAEYGVSTGGPVTVDLAAVMRRVKAVSGRSNQGVTRWIEGMENVELVRGHARFVAPRAVEVDGRRLEADRVFVNVGARPVRPDVPGLEEVDFLTSSGLLELEQTPEHLIVIGGSYIGLEFAQAFRRFGSRVTVVERGARLIGREDPDVSAAVRDVLETEGVQVRTDADCIGVRPGERGGVVVRSRCDESERELEGSHLLVAVGRRPNTDDLGLEAAGIETDERGHIVVDDQLRTSVPDVWALGDVNGRGAFTHTAYNDYEIVAANLFDGGERRLSERITSYGLFVDPPLGRVGWTEAEARASGRNVLVARYAMSNVARAKERGETDGFMKVLADGDTGEILGAAILGIGGDEIVHSLLDLMVAGAPYTVISRSVPIHPTVSELLPTALQNLRPLDEE